VCVAHWVLPGPQVMAILVMDTGGMTDSAQIRRFQHTLILGNAVEWEGLDLTRASRSAC
jgi:hypothetical protein